jgi:hypothetical protein
VRGGGVYVAGGSGRVSLSDCSVVGNVASGNGGGVD